MNLFSELSLLLENARAPALRLPTVGFNAPLRLSRISTTKTILAFVFALAFAPQAMAETPVPKSLARMSVDDQAFVCRRLLKDTADSGTRLVYITEDEARGAKVLLRVYFSWQRAISNQSAQRNFDLAMWLAKRPIDEQWVFETMNMHTWCRETGFDIYAGLSPGTRATIDKEVREEFLRLRLNRELRREP